MIKNIFESVIFIGESKSDKLDVRNYTTSIKEDTNIKDNSLKPAYIVKFYDNNKTYFGKASVCKNYNCITDKIESGTFVYNVEVLKKFRGQGLSHIIIKHMIKEYNIKALHVDIDNTPAVKCYKSHGFKVVHKFYKSGDKKNRNVRMER